MNAPVIGTHLASLNLFREPDGSVQITVAAARGAMIEGLATLPKGHKLSPQNYVEGLIVEAAKNIVARRPDLKPEASDLAVAIGEHAFRTGYRKGADDTHEGRYDVDYQWSEYDPPEELKGRDFQ